MNTEAHTTATSYIKQCSMRISVCSNIAVSHSYLSRLMEFNGISAALSRAQSSGGVEEEQAGR